MWVKQITVTNVIECDVIRWVSWKIVSEEHLDFSAATVKYIK